MKTTTNEQTRDLVEARRHDSGGVRLFTSQDATGAAFSLADYGVDAVCALVTFANGWRGFTWPATWGDVGQADAQAILSETGAAGREGAEAKEVRAEG